MWLVEVTLTHFFANKVIFGNWNQDSHVQEFPFDMKKSAWAIDKIMKLVGPLEQDKDPKYKTKFDLVEFFMKQGLIKVESLEEELAKVNVSPDCVGFLRYLLNINHKTRPTAEQALQHPWRQDLE
ncbi:hypothetical protein D8B26_007090 [Coccidioides posadasii str. Silveira]|uniref:uncharacterized protein n=1 Tax=Coccidioides posadasii (strain RMSCC 757 / Silveira) TaxID=443226 RepID=UPI001BEF5FFA|nr:hypothetical protein D8B26_007090 [Coccidioides posadasii str. Silveira]